MCKLGSLGGTHEDRDTSRGPGRLGVWRGENPVYLRASNEAVADSWEESGTECSWMAITEAPRPVMMPMLGNRAVTFADMRVRWESQSPGPGFLASPIRTPANA